MVTDRDISVLTAVCLYGVLSRPQIQRLCFPGDQNGRITRRRLQALTEAHLINRHEFSVYSISGGSPGSAYFPSRKGCEFLAEFTGDQRMLNVSTRTPPAHLLFHFIEVAETHITLDAAIARQSDVKLDGWLNEWDVANPNATEPEHLFRLYALITARPKLVCAPDAAFLLSLNEHRKVMYVEVDRNTSGVQRIAASKTPGYSALAAQKMHRRHFPSTTIDAFSVLIIAPTERRRDALRTAVRSTKGADVNFWKFAAKKDVRPETFLHESIWYPCSGDPVTLVNPSYRKTQLPAIQEGQHS